MNRSHHPFATLSLFMFLIASSLFPKLSYAWNIEMAAGKTSQKETTLRVALNKAWSQTYFDSSIGYLSGYWSTAYTRWSKGDHGKTVHSISISPVLTYHFYTKNSLKPFIEAGIGITAFNKTRVGSRNMGSSFQFEDRLGLGVRFGNHTIGLRAIHYSNAGMKKPNNGIESYSLYYSYKF